MADQEPYNCSICLQLFEDPVTTGCGHSYCMKCINTFWDRTDSEGESYSCPQCRQRFTCRPILKRNILLSHVLEELRKTTAQSTGAAAPEDGDAYYGPDDVQCDICSGRKQKAHMFCLVCLVSYCESHLQPHLEVPQLKKHDLIQASARVKESICSHHNKLKEIYCRTDQQFACVLCALSEHKNHHTVTVAAEKMEMQKQLESTKKEIADRVLRSKGQMSRLMEAADIIRDATWEVCDDFERHCEEHIRSYVHAVEKMCSRMREKVGEAEKAGVDQTNGHLRQLKREVCELRRREEKLNQLSRIEDPIQFVQDFRALDDLPVLPDSHEKIDCVTELATAQKDKLKHMCNNEKTKLSSHLEDNATMMPRIHKEMPSRKYLLILSKNYKMEVDPNTVAACLCITEGNRGISWSGSDQGHPDHPDRFTFYHQSLCKDGLTDCHYWEVEWDIGIVEVAVSYKHIQRKGSGKDCCFGHNNLSWKLVCFPSGCTFWHNNLWKAHIPPASSRKVGVHLDYKAGVLCFYSVSDSGCLTLLHRVQTTFTMPLYPGFCIDLGSTLQIRNI